MLCGEDIARVKRISKRMYNFLNFPAAWREIFLTRFAGECKWIKYSDEDINWSEEVNEPP